MRTPETREVSRITLFTTNRDDDGTIFEAAAAAWFVWRTATVGSIGPMIGQSQSVKSVPFGSDRALSVVA